MKISAKGRYAILMLVDLAEHHDQGFVSLKEIANRQGISKKYLEQIVISLNPLQLLASNRGYQGGYSLQKDPSTVSVWEILNETEESAIPVACMKKENCANACAAQWLWEGLNEVTEEYLRSITLQDLVDHETKGALN